MSHTDPSADNVPLKSDCAYARANLELHFPRMSEDPFVHDASHIIMFTYGSNNHKGSYMTINFDTGQSHNLQWFEMINIINKVNLMDQPAPSG